MTDPIGSEPLRLPLGRRRFMAALAGTLLAAPLAAQAQPAGKVWRIGFLQPGLAPANLNGPFRQGLRDQLERRQFMMAVAAGLLAAPLAAEAQQTRKPIPRIAFLTTTSPEDSPNPRQAVPNPATTMLYS